MSDPVSDAPLLVMRGISKRFAGVQALDEVDFTARRGEVHALMGENGAGKSTLLKVLTGVHIRDAGGVEFDGRPFFPRTPREAQEGGVSTVYQEVNLIPHLSVAENVCLGRQPRRLGLLNWNASRRRARAALERMGLDLDVDRPLSSYPIAIQQMVAIARALDIDTKLLVLDEPTSSLDANEVRRLFDVVKRLKAQGLGIIFVTHFLDQVYEISDRITILRNGRLVGEYEAAALPPVALVAKMLGRDPEGLQAAAREHAAARPADDAPPLIEARGIGRRGVMHPLDLNIRAGEVVGLAGLLGSGRTETARMLFGVDKADTGTVRVDGRPVPLSSPRRAIAQRFGFLSEDRKSEGIIPELSIRENMILAIQARRGWLRPLSRRKQEEIAQKYIRVLNIATPDAEKPIGQLSGGNQQKVLLARWMASDPRFLILDEPTRGIDVGAKAEIEKLVGQLCREGMAILFISSELDEVVRCAGRVVVLRDRRKVGELSGAQVDASTILRTIAEADSRAGVSDVRTQN